MSDVFATAVAALSTALKASAGVEGVYRRKTGEFADLTVTRGRSEREQTTDRNIVSVVTSDDILVDTADFETAFGTDARPYDGDSWEEGGKLYKVRPLGGEPAWRKSDPGGVRLRIHLKLEGDLP